MTRKFDPRQSHAADKDLVGADGFGSFKAYAAGGGNNVILINTVAADAYGSNQHSVFVKRHAARKDLKAIWQSGDC